MTHSIAIAPYDIFIPLLQVVDNGGLTNMIQLTLRISINICKKVIFQ